MAHSSELFNGSHDTGMFVDDEPTKAEVSSQKTDKIASELGSKAAAMTDIELEWGPARRRPDAPTFETEPPEGLSWSA
jgi:hypothetical protein